MVALLVLSVLAPHKVSSYPGLVNWPTIATLLGLMILTKGVELSGWLYRFGRQIIMGIDNQRMLALFLVAASALLAMLLTNDIALFIVVPLTLGLGQLAELPLRRLVIFEALAVNAGSMLTPIGNPQNIFLWQLSGVRFDGFMLHMLPPFLIASGCLLLLTLAAFRPLRMQVNGNPRLPPLRRPLLTASALLYVPFLVLADLRYAWAGLLLVTVVFLLAFPRILRQIDWALMAVFVLMFVDLGLLARYPVLPLLDLTHTGTLYLTGVVSSQIISNVPTAILLTKYSSDWSTIAWAVNVGSFGVVIGSLASIIALRIGRQPGSFAAFHAWSVPFFLVVGTLTYIYLQHR
ncbi:MAG: anion transporter [Gammaproteobacteria bacterium]|nr:anion transporter [Gammaproteobacteria bacterium]